MKPKNLFLIDSMGALVSTILLGFVLVQLEAYFGMPAKVLYPLAAVAGIFALYSFSNYQWFGENWRPRLTIIAIANLVYCTITAILVINRLSELSILGVLYFVGEIIIVTTLAFIELRTAQGALKTR